MKKTQVIFFGLRTTNGGLLVKTWFFPLKSWKYLEKFWKIWKIWKNELDSAGTIPCLLFLWVLLGCQYQRILLFFKDVNNDTVHQCYVQHHLLFIARMMWAWVAFEWFTCSFYVTVFKILLPQELLVEVSQCIVHQEIILPQKSFLFTEVAMKVCQEGIGRVVMPHVIGLRSCWAGIEGLLVLLWQGLASLPDPGPDSVCTAVPLPGKVVRADQVLHALSDDLLPLLERHVLCAETGRAGQENMRNIKIMSLSPQSPPICYYIIYGQLLTEVSSLPWQLLFDPPCSVQWPHLHHPVMHRQGENDNLRWSMKTCCPLPSAATCCCCCCCMWICCCCCCWGCTCCSWSCCCCCCGT